MARVLLARTWLAPSRDQVCWGPWCVLHSCAFRQLRNYATRTSCYDVLEVTPKASQAQIKAAYYRLSKRYHPGVNDSKDASAKFAPFSEACGSLGHQKNRMQYDRGMMNPTAASVNDSRSEEVIYDRYTGILNKRTGPVYGKTKIYDFDEFYRQHYGASMGQKNADKFRYKQYLKDQKEQLEKDRVSMFIAGIGIAFMGFAMLFGRRKPPRKFLLIYLVVLF